MSAVDRRGFLTSGLSCGAWLLASLAGASTVTRQLFAATPRGIPLRTEPWGRLERIADGVWMLVSTPLAGDHDSGAMRTFSNGGIVAGRDGVLAIEGFATEEGSRWLAGEARRLTGRWPTHVVLTHYHGDHSAGLGGYRAEGQPVEILGTETTRDLLHRKRPDATLPTTMIAPRRATEIDLGGRRVKIEPREGHTPSDLTIEVLDPRVVWCGDLVWIGLFPNFVDATPSRQTAHVRKLLAEPATLWVPGHGSAARTAELRGFLTLLESIEQGARDAFKRGVTAAEAARDWRTPRALGEWVMFSEDYYEVAFRAWERELRP
ncbi:MAG TPA: MBL fold metallo-hydrolase [Gemmatimonadales bacterium]|jgi:glyoxylase-like metal-dependent hydrolase (beta-lactamase superfamily II)